MFITSRPTSLQAASLWKLVVSLPIGLAVILIPVSVILSLLSFFGIKGAIEAMDAIGGFSSGSEQWRLLLANVALVILYALFLGVVLAVSVWIGAYIHPKVFRGKNRASFESPVDTIPDEAASRPGVRDIITRLTFIRCLRDLLIGTAWTAVIIGIPVFIILMLVGEIRGSTEDIISWFLTLPAGALLLVVIAGPILMLGFWLIRAISKLTVRRAPTTT